MQPATVTAPIAKTNLWVGRIISALAVLFLLSDGVMKVMLLAPVVESGVRSEYP